MTEQEIQKKLAACDTGELYAVWYTICAYMPPRWYMIKELASIASDDEDVESALWKGLQTVERANHG